MSGTTAKGTALKKHLYVIFLSSLIGIVLLFSACLIVYSTDDPDASSKYASLAAYFISSFAAGVIASKTMNGNMYAVLAAAISWALIWTVVSLAAFGQNSDIGTSILMRLAGVGASVFGGLISKRGKGRARSAKRRRRHGNRK
ncbi:MAG: YrzE family protein [Clostridia bacterium]|nr:YrzE family protein [Clostridia bacterium]